MAQTYAYPTTDTTRDNWTEFDGTTTSIYEQIDDVTADDTNFICTIVAPASDVYVTKFNTLTDPQSSSNHTVSLRYGKEVTSGDTISLVGQLRQGYTDEGNQGTLIATVLNNTDISSGWTQVDYTLTESEANSITDYSSLYLRLVGNTETATNSTTAPTHIATSTISTGGTTSTTITSSSPAVALAISNASLPNGATDLTYATALTAVGGLAPYSWSVTTGSLPSGLSLNSTTGIISGTPTGSGTTNFTIRVTDSTSPTAATSDKALSITLGGYATIFGSTYSGAPANSGETGYELGVKFKSSVAGSVVGLRFYKESANTGTHVGRLWSSSGTKLAEVTFTNETSSGWQEMLFSNPVSISANTQYVASYTAPTDDWSFSTNFFTSDYVNGVLTAYNNATTDNGVYQTYADLFPIYTYQASNYWVDVLFSSTDTALASITVTSSVSTIKKNEILQFTAIGTYGDGSSQDITNQVTWTTSSATVATIIAATGLVTGVGVGTSTITATLNSISNNKELTVKSTNDLLLIFVESSDSTTAAGTPNTPTDWYKIFERTEGGGALNVTTLTIFARLSPLNGLANVVVDGVANHILGLMMTIDNHGISSVDTDIVVGTGAGHGTGTTSLTTTSINVTANSMIVWAIGLSDDASDTSNAATYTNANLANISEKRDNTQTTGAGGGVAVATATCSGTSTGNGTWAHDTAVQSQSVYLGIKPHFLTRRAQVSWARFEVPVQESLFVGYWSVNGITVI